MAITILGLVCAPICSSLVLAARVNQRSSQVMAAQLSVSNAVEQLMAEGILYENESGTITTKLPRIEGVNIEIDNSGSNAGVYYKVIVTSDTVDTVKVTTHVRATPAEGGG